MRLPHTRTFDTPSVETRDSKKGEVAFLCYGCNDGESSLRYEPHFW